MPQEVTLATMAAENAPGRAEWQPSPQPEDSVISPEHLALVDFAHRLGCVTTNDEPGIADDRDVKQDANLLMSLLSSPPHVVSDDLEHNSLSSVASAGSASSSSQPPGDHHYLSDASTSSATSASSFSNRRESFRFSHPSLSLDCKWKQRPLRTPCTAPDNAEDEAEENESQPPAVLLGRALKVDDREAHRLSADAMARNLLQSFQKAIKWRIQAWMDTLMESLVAQEKALLRQNASEEEIRELLKTGEAQLYARLRQVAQKIEVQHAETTFHVLPQRVQREQQEEEAESPVTKRRRIESEDSLDSELRMGETEYQYTVCHALEFDGTIHLNTPAGHSEITLEVPGFIEGTFLSSEPGMEDLTAVEVEIDTNILASMVEKSCRIVVRSSVEHICKQQKVVVEEEEDATEEEEEDAAMTSPYPKFQGTTTMPGPHKSAAIVTPRAGSSLCVGGAGTEPGYLQIPEDLDCVNRKEARRISPQPRSPDMERGPFTLATPRASPLRPLPIAMVSPAPKAEIVHDKGFKLAKRREARAKTRENGTNLPVLVEVACAAMQAKAGVTGQ